MPPTAKQGFGRRFRRWFRWCRITLLCFLCLLLGGLAYLNRVGLPDFLKTRLVTELRARGVVLEFTRMRLRWYHGLVAENVSLGPVDDPAGPHLSIGEVDLRLDRGALRKLRFQVNSLRLHDGRIVVPLVSANAPSEQFVVNNIVTELHLLPNDRWELEHFEALCLGARIFLSGTLTNASAVAKWQFKRSADQSPGLWQSQLRQAVKIARQMHFSRPPDIFLSLRGDASEPAGIAADLRFGARDADTAWGKFEKLLLLANLNHPTDSNGLGQSELKLQLDDVRTPWGQAKLTRLYLRWAQSFTNPMPAEVKLDWELSGVATPWGAIPQARFNGRSRQASDGSGLLKTELTLDAGVFQSEWFQLKTNRLTAQIIHSPDSALPLQAHWQWVVENPTSRWGVAQHFELNGHAARGPASAPPRSDSSWAWWAPLEPFQIDWESRIDRVGLTNVVVDHIAIAGDWRSPELSVQELHADLYGRQLDFSGRIHVATREARWRGGFDFDVRKIGSLLTPGSQEWLSQYTWTEPPKVSGQARVILPAWTNSHPDWRAQVLPTLQLEGELQAGQAAFRDVPISSARSHFSFSNLVWQLPDFVGTRPEGRIEFAYTSSIQNHDYHFRLRSQFDPLALKPLFGMEPHRAFDFFQFHEPPLLEAEIWGQWRDPEKFGAVGRVSATNMVFREAPIGELSAALSFTNRFLTATDVMIRSGGPQVSASGVGYDLAAQTVYLTNAHSTMDPKRIIHAIGPQTERVMRPYTFAMPPTATVNGWVEVRRGKHSDMHFEISGGPFTYWKFNTPQVSGVVRWVNEMVTITNLQADFYRGKLAAQMHFDCAAPRGADFNLHAEVADADLHQLIGDISSPTNRLEGTLSGDLTITKANTADWDSWNGFGQARLHDGFLWDMPLFGIFSPVLNAVIPGVGSSRVSGGAATFTITNSVIHTDDMEIRSPAMRLEYRGAIDFKGGVNARVEARLLRDAWVIGPLVSLVLSPLTKLFEYRVTGTLREPQKEPLYIPKPLLFPLHPFRTLKEIFSEEKPDKPNPPPAEKPPP